MKRLTKVVESQSESVLGFLNPYESAYKSLEKIDKDKKLKEKQLKDIADAEKEKQRKKKKIITPVDDDENQPKIETRASLFSNWKLPNLGFYQEKDPVLAMLHKVSDADGMHAIHLTMLKFKIGQAEQRIWLRMWIEMVGEGNFLLQYRNFISYFRIEDCLWTKRLFEIINSSLSGPVSFLEWIRFCGRYLMVDRESSVEFSFRLLSRRGGTAYSQYSVLDNQDLKTYLGHRYVFKNFERLKKWSFALLCQMNLMGDAGVDTKEFGMYCRTNTVFVRYFHLYLMHLRKAVFGVGFWVKRSRRMRSDQSALSSLGQLAGVSANFDSEMFCLTSLGQPVTDSRGRGIDFPALSRAEREKERKEKKEKEEADRRLKKEEHEARERMRAERELLGLEGSQKLPSSLSSPSSRAVTPLTPLTPLSPSEIDKKNPKIDQKKGEKGGEREKEKEKEKEKVSIFSKYEEEGDISSDEEENEEEGEGEGERGEGSEGRRVREEEGEGEGRSMSSWREPLLIWSHPKGDFDSDFSREVVEEKRRKLEARRRAGESVMRAEQGVVLTGGEGKGERRKSKKKNKSNKQVEEEEQAEVARKEEEERAKEEERERARRMEEGQRRRVREMEERVMRLEREVEGMRREGLVRGVGRREERGWEGVGEYGQGLRMEYMLSRVEQLSLTASALSLSQSLPPLPIPSPTPSPSIPPPIPIPPSPSSSRSLSPSFSHSSSSPRPRSKKKQHNQNHKNHTPPLTITTTIIDETSIKEEQTTSTSQPQSLPLPPPAPSPLLSLSLPPSLSLPSLLSLPLGSRLALLSDLAEREAEEDAVRGYMEREGNKNRRLAHQDRALSLESYLPYLQ